jgi:hypothetical protein
LRRTDLKKDKEDAHLRNFGEPWFVMRRRRDRGVNSRRDRDEMRDVCELWFPKTLRVVFLWEAMGDPVRSGSREVENVALHYWVLEVGLEVCDHRVNWLLERLKTWYHMIGFSGETGIIYLFVLGEYTIV